METVEITTWNLQHLHPVQQRRGDGRSGVCSGNEEHLGKVKGHVEVMVCEAVVLLWVQDLRIYQKTGFKLTLAVKFDRRDN